jgi:hypothetical protein
MFEFESKFHTFAIGILPLVFGLICCLSAAGCVFSSFGESIHAEDPNFDAPATVSTY